ncbi:cation transporter [Kineosporia sp. R_H_3]|uniref:cation transporter n=1 Tax=Kineosporia sp. R_H_3 TaxID=1961848 RepID=UPI0018E95E7D|nr:cation transporter [Kineosporia sp. R_H_3]
MVLVPATAGSPDRLALAARVRVLSWVTLVWLAIDGVVGMSAGIAADSVALIGWGLDCAIEAAAALVIIWRFSGDRIHSVTAERLAQKVVAVSFILLVPYIVVAAIDHLATGNAAGGSWVGIGLAGIDAALMPILGRAKKRLGRQLGSHATSGAGTQNILCAYLSIAVLIGLVANAALGWWRADPIVALVVAAACLQAGWNTWRGNTCDDEISC